MSERKDYGEPWVDLTNTFGDTIDDRDGKTERLEKMVPGTLANLLSVTGARDQLTEAHIAEIIDERMVKACYDPMGKEIAALIVAANLLTLKGDKK